MVRQREALSPPRMQIAPIVPPGVPHGALLGLLLVYPPQTTTRRTRTTRTTTAVAVAVAVAVVVAVVAVAVVAAAAAELVQTAAFHTQARRRLHPPDLAHLPRPAAQWRKVAWVALVVYPIPLNRPDGTHWLLPTATPRLLQAGSSPKVATRAALQRWPVDLCRANRDISEQESSAVRLLRLQLRGPGAHCKPKMTVQTMPQ